MILCWTRLSRWRRLALLGMLDEFGFPRVGAGDDLYVQRNAWSTWAYRSADGRELPALDDLVDDPVLLGFLGGQDLVALDVEADLLRGLAAVLGQRRLQQLAHAGDLRRLDLQVRHLAVDALGGRLVDEDPRVRHGEALAGRARGQQHRRGRGGLPEADRGDLRAHVLHRVVNGHQRGERATRRVDVHQDVAVRVGRLQHEQLGHDVVRGRVVDLHPEEDDALLEELVVRVGLLDPVARALDEGRQHVPGLSRLVTHRALPFPCWGASGSCPARLITWSTKP